MLVLVNEGPRKGQIQDIEPSAARRMLADGRASTINYDAASESEKAEEKAEGKTKRKK